MHIKRIVIRGYKTYGRETIIDDFSSKTNLILGKNGSGKSNLLDAIQFVLTDKYLKLSTDERSKLLHEGAGEKALQAQVDIIFDNSDKRLPVEPPKDKKDSSEVCLTRTIGAKKDQFLVNGNPYSESDFQNLLESAGFSRAHPYNIVEQGTIAHLTKQSNLERLELLKEIAGTRTYDDRKKESYKIMKETDTKLAQITKVIDSLTTRENELKGEAAELKKFLSVDDNRRSLEYSIYEHERHSAQTKLDGIELKRASGGRESEDQSAAYQQAKEEVKAAEEEVELLQSRLSKARTLKKQLSSQETGLVKRRTELELGIKDLKDKLSGARGSKEEASSELKTLQKKIKETNAKLEKLTAEFVSIAGEEEKLSLAFQRCDQRLADLAAKRHRSTTAGTKAARDADLKKQLTTANKQKKDVTIQLEKLQGEINASQKSAEKLTKEIEKKEAQVQANREQGDKLNAALTTQTEKRDAGLNSRKAAWKSEQELRSEFSDLKGKMEKAERTLQYTMDKDLFRGINTVKQIASELKLTGVYGPLIELFEVGDSFWTCVEITGGNSLFHIVVDTDATAARLVKELLDRKGGRVTFIPLNRIHPTKPAYPTTGDAMPMITQLKYDSKYEKAMLQVFGKTLITRDLSVGATLATQYDLNTITLSGDRVDKKGALTGGHNELSERGKSRLGAQADIRKYQTRWEEVQRDLATIENDLSGFDQSITDLVKELTNLGEKKASLRSQNTSLTQEISQAKKELKALNDTIGRNEKLLPPLRASLASIETQVESLEAEQSSPFRSGLAGEEEDEFKRLTIEADKLKHDLMKVRGKKADIEASKVEVESLLNSNLNRQADELNARLNAGTQEEDVDILQRDEQELAQLVTQIKELDAEMKAAEKEIDEDTKKIRDLQNQLEGLRSTASERHAALSEESKTMEKLLSQKLIYQQKRDEANKKIRELGSLPAAAFEKFKDLTVKQLFDRLEKAQSEVKKFTGVNKKAIEQLAQITEQLGELADRKKELDDGRKSIEDLIAHLDLKKDEAIDRTFKTIAKHFSEVFHELVPTGNATLVLETGGLDGVEEREGGGEEEEEEEKEEKSTRRPKKKSKKDVTPTASYTGVHMQVAFGESATGTKKHQLSGGQESVVALSLIFAIQRCDPSPFYLLDEIDAALDPVYRTAVAEMIKEQESQFICTTFHQEFVHVAEKLIGVTFSHKQSHVRVINHREAMQLIQLSEREHEKP